MQIKNLGSVRKLEMVLVADIIVMAPRRHVSASTVQTLAESIDKIGLLNPIIVREEASSDSLLLVCGLHRLEAFRELQRDRIPAFILTASTTEIEARMTELAENLHRVELTELERAEQIHEWRELAKVRKLSAPSNHQPAGSGARETARELGVDEKTVRNASRIASIIPEAKEAARNEGIEDNQSKLLQVAAAPRMQQVATVRKLAAAKSSPTEIVNGAVVRVEKSERQEAASRRSRQTAKPSPRARCRGAKKQKDQEVRKKRQHEQDATINVTALVERHGLESARAFAQFLLSIPEPKWREVLEHLAEYREGEAV
jgi:ParB family chromosome partitioning protein